MNDCQINWDMSLIVLRYSQGNLKPALKRVSFDGYPPYFQTVPYTLIKQHVPDTGRNGFDFYCSAGIRQNEEPV